jgi:hypothetical protein
VVAVEHHQGMLDQRQLILAVARFGNQPFGELTADLAVIQRGRFPDGAQQVVVIHARQEVLSRIHRLGKTGKAGAGAEILGPHGQHHIEPGLGVLKVLHEASDQQHCLFGTVPACVVEELLELVDEKAHMTAEPVKEQLHERGRCFPAEVQGTPVFHHARMVPLAPLELCQRLGEIPQRRFARRGAAGEPAHTSACAFLLQTRLDAGTHHGALSTARIPMDNNEPPPDQLPDDSIGHLLPPEKDRPFILFKRPKPWVGTRRQLHPEDLVEEHIVSHDDYSALALFSESQRCTLGVHGG